jgi:hypothetical protein
MKYYAIAVGKTNESLLRDNYLNEKKEPISGVLFFKKKENAEIECISMNKLRKGMKLTECYSVARVDESECGIYGKIVDGKQG